MSDKSWQIQEQKQTQVQKLAQSISQQQMLVSSLVELPITQLADRINTEMNDNPALEVESPGENADFSDYSDYSENTEYSDYSEYAEKADDAALSEREERQSALDAALENIGRDDEELPVYHGGSNLSEDREEMVFGTTESFYDQLLEQMRESDLTDRQREVIRLYYFDGLNQEEIASKLKITQQATSKALNQAIQRIKNVFSGLGKNT